MELSKEQKRKMLAYQKVKLEERGEFKVLELNDDHALCLYLDRIELQAIVPYGLISEFDIMPSDYFEVGDIFRGEVFRKGRELTLIVKPLLNLKEIKDKKKLEQKQNEFMKGLLGNARE